MADQEEQPKKKKRSDPATATCVICENDSPLDNLVHLKDKDSWDTLYQAAQLRNFSAITKLYVNDKTVPHVLYHRKCRSDFTHKKELAKIRQFNENDINQQNETRQSQRCSSTSSSRVYERICIFCQRVSKYVKGSKTREALTQAVELRADQRIRDEATHRGDQRILSVVSRDIVAAEAHYHLTCYKLYVHGRRPSTKSGDSITDPYSKEEKDAFKLLFHFIRTDIILKPRIVPLVDITTKLVSFLNEKGLEPKDSTKTHLRRTLEMEFGDLLHFFTVGRNVYVRPHSLSTDSIAKDFLILQKKLERNVSEETEDLLSKVALLLRDDIKCSTEEQSWPPRPDEMTNDYIKLPNNLKIFLNVLLSGDNGNVLDRNSRITWSIGMDIINAVTNAEVVTPKHLLLSWAIKTLTGNVELIRMLNRLGHSCSYTKLEEVDTALCIEKLDADSGKPHLPSGVHPCIPSVLAFDNIDRLEETVSGAGTSHRVNGIIVQPTVSSCAQERGTHRTDKRDKRRTITSPVDLLPLYISSKREGPPPLKAVQLSQAQLDAIKDANQLNDLWVITRLHYSDHQTVSSWTGFNIRTRDDAILKTSRVGYLPTINAPATELSTVHEILCQSELIRQQLNVEKIAVVMDQALYAKATEVAWKQKLKFENIELMMGNFHIICNLLSIIGKLFRDAGLRDLAVQSGVIAEGSIDKVLAGKQYNRGVRLHKVTYEAMMRLLWSGFLHWIEINKPGDTGNIDVTIQCVIELQDNPCAAQLRTFLDNKSCQSVLHLFRSYLDIQRTDGGQLAAFWMMYIDLVEILLGLIRADREGDWQLHISCIRHMIPWCFAMDKTNYARYLPVYHLQMSKLQDRSPELHRYFMNGGFSVQMGETNTFGRVAVDQTLEETINRDTQTAGGTKGFSLKHGAVSRYYLTAEYRAEALRQLRQIVSLRNTGFSHRDLQKTRIEKDEEDVKSIFEILESNWTNPFSNDPMDLVNLSTGAVAPPNICKDLLGAHEKGERAYIMHLKKLEEGDGFYEPIPKLKVKTFTCMQKAASSKGTNKEMVLKADNRLFGYMLLVAQNRKLDMQEVLSYPLGSKPWALANGDGTLKKTDKASLSRHIEKETVKTDIPTCKRATVVDAMAIVQKVHGENLTFDELSQTILKQILINGHGSERIDVVFDVYVEQSIKAAERVARGSKEGIAFTCIKGGHQIKNWKRILNSTESKSRLTKFLAESWKTEKSRDQLGCTTLIVTSEEKCFKITKDGVTEVEELKSSQEEADTRLVIHAKHAAQSYPQVIIVSEDTDVLVIFLGVHTTMGSQTKFILRRGKGNKMRLIDVTRLALVLGEDVCRALIGLHAWTGCDTVSCFAGQGKVKAFGLIRNIEKFRLAFGDIGSEWHVTNELFETIQEFTCRLYCRNTTISKVNTLRYEMFRAKRGDVVSGQLPPCEDALRQHTYRANYQAAIWRRCTENHPDIPRPEDGHGWNFADGEISIKWYTGAAAPNAVLDLLVCKCSRSCGNDCMCVKNGLKCTPACKLQNCNNIQDDEIYEEEEPRQDLMDSDSEDEN